jgi:Na+-translocating ferredoxin:NAD+ oxidoreductase subunit E
MTASAEYRLRPPRDILLMVSLCPLLAVTDTVAKGAGVGIALIIITVVSSALLALLLRRIDKDLRLPAILLVTASIVAMLELLMQAWFHDLRQSLGVFLALIVANVGLVSQLHEEDLGTSQRVLRSVKLAFIIAVVLFTLGIARELVGRGSLLHGAANTLGTWAAAGELIVFRVDMGFLLAMLPPGAFIALGLLIACGKWIAQRRFPSSVNGGS